MKTYIYQDEKSHKFWAVEQQDNELHITWGKVGTNGQSQVKSFADAATAEKAELKLIAEKVKKGVCGRIIFAIPTRNQNRNDRSRYNWRGRNHCRI
ncbi:regulator [Escherichia coli]|uniref:Regulator n=1 Tax=Escherichia coli TaxID=562 RepID=A0A377BA74_ECOLX|nr:regulator [Escherichia coli]